MPRFSITGSFEPETRVQGLLAIGERQSNVSDSGLESYDEIARGVAEQVVDEQHRATFIGCTPQMPKSNDDRLHALVLRRASGRCSTAVRSPGDELQTQVNEAAKATGKLHDFYARAVVRCRRC